MADVGSGSGINYHVLYISGQHITQDEKLHSKSASFCRDVLRKASLPFHFISDSSTQRSLYGTKTRRKEEVMAVNMQSYFVQWIMVTNSCTVGDMQTTEEQEEAVL